MVFKILDGIRNQYCGIIIISTYTTSVLLSSICEVHCIKVRIKIKDLVEIGARIFELC